MSDDSPTLRSRLRSLRGHATDFAAYLAVRAFVAVVQTMPLDMGDACCRTFARWVTRYLRIRQRITDENLSRVFPESTPADRRRIEEAMWHSLMLMVCEVAWAQRRLHLTNWSQYVRFRNNQACLRFILSQRPTVSVTGHFGNFEIGGYTLGLMGCESTTIARRLDNRFLHAWVERFRSAKGQRLLDKEGCAAEVDRHLDEGGALAILADQHGGPKGCWTDFLGVPASCHKALALFSLGSGAPMLACYTRRLDRKPMQFESGVVDIADPFNDPDANCESVDSLTRWYNRQLAQVIGDSVEQYWWLHRRWREPPPKIAKRLARAA